MGRAVYLEKLEKSEEMGTLHHDPEENFRNLLIFLKLL